MIVEPATVADLPLVAGLETTFPPRERWSEASWADELAGEHRVVLVARDAGRLVGVILLAVVDDTADLHRIIVAPDRRREGIADALMRAGLAQVHTRVLLEVRDDNVGAIRLYRRHGFVEIARRTDYYGAGVDAIIHERRADA